MDGSRDFYPPLQRGQKRKRDTEREPAAHRDFRPGPRASHNLRGGFRQEQYRQDSGSSQDSANSIVDWGFRERGQSRGRSRERSERSYSSAGYGAYDDRRPRSARSDVVRVSSSRWLSVDSCSTSRSCSQPRYLSQATYVRHNTIRLKERSPSFKYTPDPPKSTTPDNRKLPAGFKSSERIAYLHQPLRLPREQFRLVRVLRPGDGGPNDPIVCELRTFTIGDVQDYRSYTALSYTWGSTEATYPIYVTHGARHHAEAFKVRAHLYDILSHIRERADADTSKRWSGWWWIDSICILQDKSQDTNNENRIQIGIMREIYRSAAEVYAWIGAVNNVTDVGMSFIQKTGSQHRLEADEGSKDTREAYQMICNSIEDIFKKEYWSRLWILQELAVARNTTLACGTKEVPWSALIRFGTEVATWKDVPPDAHVRKRQYVWLISKIYQKDPGRLNLAELVFLSEHAECSEPQDHILALLGLVAPGRGRTINPEDKASPCQILSRAVRIMILDQPKTLRKRYKKLVAEETHQCALLEDPDDVGTDCEAVQEHLAICRRVARVICEGLEGVPSRPLLVDILPSQERWRFYRDSMVRDTSRKTAERRVTHVFEYI